jgi:hypothetical protein
VNDLIAAGVSADEHEKRDGKQGALDGIPNLALGNVIGSLIRADDGTGGAPPKKDSTEKSTGKEEGKEGKEDKEGKESSEKGKDASDAGDPAKPSADSIDIGFARFGLPELIEAERLDAVVQAHAARELVKGPIV